MPAAIGAPDFKFIIRTPDDAHEFQIGTFAVPITVLPGQCGEAELVCNMMLAEAIRAAADAVQQIVDADDRMTELIIPVEPDTAT